MADEITRLRRAAAAVVAIRPANWDDDEDPAQRAAWLALDAALAGQEEVPVPVTIFCPSCAVPHVDEGEWATTRHHKTHQCQSCGHEWRPFPFATVGVAHPAALTPGEGEAPVAWRSMESAPKTPADTLIARPFLGWCPDETAPAGGDIRVCWWEPKVRGGCWWSDRDLPEDPVLWRSLPDAPGVSRPTPATPAGWIVANGNGDRWRTWKDGFSAWTTDREKATRYARREDAEAVHAEDEDAWLVQPYAPATPEGLLSYLVEQQGLHRSTANLVLRFAQALGEKLAKAERKYGYSDGWLDEGWRDDLIVKLQEHVQKGDPRDVAAYCAFAWHHEWSITPAVPEESISRSREKPTATPEGLREKVVHLRCCMGAALAGMKARADVDRQRNLESVLAEFITKTDAILAALQPQASEAAAHG